MRYLNLVLAIASAPTPAAAQFAHRLNSPCGRGESSESVLMCGQNACEERLTIPSQIKGGGKPRFEQTMSNSLFNVYETNGPDLTIGK